MLFLFSFLLLFYNVEACASTLRVFGKPTSCCAETGTCPDSSCDVLRLGSSSKFVCDGSAQGNCPKSFCEYAGHCDPKTLKPENGTTPYCYGVVRCGDQHEKKDLSSTECKGYGHPCLSVGADPKFAICEGCISDDSCNIGEFCNETLLECQPNDHSSCDRVLFQKLHNAEYAKELCRMVNGTNFTDPVCQEALTLPHDERMRRLERASYPPHGHVNSNHNRDRQACDVSNWLGKCPISGHQSRLLVISNGHPGNGLEWLNKVDAPHVVYTRGHMVNKSNYVYIPGVFGYEAAVFIRFILDCWDNLPDSVAFLHEHQSSWHSSDMAEILKRFKWGKHHYASVNFLTDSFKHDSKVRYFHNPFNSGERLDWITLKAFWDPYFARELGPMPKQFHAIHTCAQFVASRDALRSRSRTFWLTAFGWLMREQLHSFWSGRCLEHTWSLLLDHTTNSSLTPMCDMLQCDS